MKKFICLLLSFILILSLAGCKKEETKSYKKNTIKYPLAEINAVYDVNGNLLQQIIYNKLTSEYIMKEYSYEYNPETCRWTCIKQETTVLTGTAPTEITDPVINKYFIKDLSTNPLTLLNTSDIKISINKYLNAAQWWEFGYELEIINKTNKVLTVVFDNFYIMSILCKPVFSVDQIYANKTAYFTMAWDSDTLERCYIPYLDNIEFQIAVYDNANRLGPALAGTRVLLKNSI